MHGILVSKAQATPWLRWLAALAAVISLASPSQTDAATPKTMAVDGVMTSTGGGPGADGNYKLTFSLYKAKTGGSPLWSEGPLLVAVTSGHFRHVLGSAKALDAALFGKSTSLWLGVQVTGEQEMTRQPLHTVAYSLVTASAESLSCSGCIKSGALAPASVGAAKVSFTYAGAKTKGGPAEKALDLACTGCVSVAEMKFDGDLDLGSHSLKANKVTAASVAANSVTANTFIGDGSKLSGIQPPAGTCKSKGYVVKGIKSDGSLQCVKAFDMSMLPPDAIGEVSNDLIANQFVDQVYGIKDFPIDDNKPAGSITVLDFPDLGIAQKLDVLVDISNSNIGKIKVSVFDPKNVEHVLYAGGGAGKTLKATYPSPTKPVNAKLENWIGHNPKGKWRLKVVDSHYLNNGKDGKVNSWSLRVLTLSSKKIQVKGDLIVNNSVQVMGDLSVGGKVQSGLDVKGGLRVGYTSVACSAALVGTKRRAPGWGEQVCHGFKDKAAKMNYAWVANLTTPIIYSGGCGTMPANNGSWTKYCLNKHEYNTAGDYLAIGADGTVTVKITGWYHIRFNTIQHGYNLRRISLIHNGGGVAEGANDKTGPSAAWAINMIDHIRAMRKGDTFYINTWAQSGNPYPFHAFGGWSRLQVTYAGAWGG